MTNPNDDIACFHGYHRCPPCDAERERQQQSRDELKKRFHYSRVDIAAFKRVLEELSVVPEGRSLAKTVNFSWPPTPPLLEPEVGVRWITIKKRGQ